MAEIRRRSRSLGWGAVTLATTLSGCGESATDPAPSEPEPEPVLAAVEVRPVERHFGVLGESIRITAWQIADDGDYMRSQAGRTIRSSRFPVRFSWSTDAPGVATVSDSGRVTTVGEGTANITATSEGFSDTTVITVTDAARLAWAIPTHSISNAGVGIGYDGTVYFGTGGELLGVDPRDGSVVGAVPVLGGVQSAPAITEDGTTYFGSSPYSDEPGGLTAVDAGGVVLWDLTSVGSVNASPALGPDGTIYVASRDSALYAVSPDGEEQWMFEVPEGFQFSSPAVAEDGTIYAGDMNGRLYAIHPDGTERWRFQAGDHIWGPASIDLDGTIYFTAFDGYLYALDPDGDERWSLDLGRELWSPPSIGTDGTLYVGGSFEGVHAVSPDGTLLWTANPGGSIASTPALGADGSIYGTSSDGRIYAFNPDGSLKWDYATGRPIPGSPAIGLDGRIYAAAYDSTAYAIEEMDASNGGFEGAPWPTAGANRANDGRARAP